MRRLKLDSKTSQGEKRHARPSTLAQLDNVAKRHRSVAIYVTKLTLEPSN